MHIPKSFIKNVAIQLPYEYKLSNSPYEIKDQNSEKQNSNNSQFYIVREKLTDKFKGFLDSSGKGVYLVTGYRGMGKTSFVNYVLNEYKKNKTESKREKILPIHLTIAQSNPKEFDVLRQVVNSIYDRYQPDKWYNRFSKMISGIVAIVIFCVGLKLFLKVEDTDKTHLPKQLTDILVFLITSLIVLWVVRKFIIKEDKALLRIKKLLERCHSSVRLENSVEDNLNLNSLTRKFYSRKERTYPIADSKEIEYELLQFLKEKDKQTEFIFIFDELDKIEINQTGFNLNEDMESYEFRNKGQNDINPLRNRKQAVLNIITGLKNFFTTANARFIFIAGREMFDASLADISDKQSPLSSIFTYTFHIESLLKEHGAEKNYTKLSVGVEEFLARQILTEGEYGKIVRKQESIGKPRNITIDDILICLKENDLENYLENDPIKAEEQARKISPDYLQVYFVLQSFVTYLLYRSSGSPKKMIKIFQEFVNVGEKFDLDCEFITLKKRSSVKTDNHSKTNHCHLYFNYPNQYRIGFVNSMYRPYILPYSRIYKSFSENTVISVPYIFDHLFKFHDFAFSVSNLELIPEAISYNKSTSLKTDLKQVIQYLYQSHIRDTDIELFDYKFYSKTAHEIMFISRIFEDEAAAFNFTLDESYPIKAILNEKIKEHRSIHSKFNVDPEKLNPQIFSIANLNSSLGDICFFDQEFHEAINCYSDVIRPINNLNVKEMNLRDFITLVRNKLKIGLCFEKINSYEEALAFYSDSLQDIKRYFSFVLVNGEYTDFEFSFFSTYNNETFYTSSLNDVLQICVQSFLANIFIQEKMGLEGMSSPKIKVDLSDFLRIIDGVACHTGRNHLIIANSMLHHGKMLYYKNTPGSTPDSTSNSNSFPAWFLKKHETSRNYFTKEDTNKRRQPILAFRIYMIGLDEAMRSRNCFVNNKEYGKFIFEGKRILKHTKVNNPELNKVIFLNQYLKRLEKFIAPGYNLPNKEDFTANHYKSIANFLSSIGDCILSMDDMKTQGDYHFNLKDIFRLKNKDFYSSLRPGNQIGKFVITDVLKCYYLSAFYYEKFGRLNSAIFEYKKIIHVLMIITKYETSVNPNNGILKNEDYIKLLKVHIVDKAMELAQKTSSRTERHIRLESQEIIKSIPPEITNRHIDDDISHGIETNEIELFFEYLKVKTFHYEITDECIEKHVSSHYLISSQYKRVISLDLYKSFLYRKIKKYEKKDKIILLENDGEINGFQKNLLEYIFSINEIIRILRIYDTNYLFGPSYQAYMHFSLANLLNKEVKYKKGKIKVRDFIDIEDEIVDKVIEDGEEIEKKFSFKENLKKILGGKSYAALDIEYHYGKAKDKYELSIQLHTAGSEYRNQIRDMIYLEDDFNDNAYHFGAAVERYLMVNDFFSRKINEINNELIKLKK